MATMLRFEPKSEESPHEELPSGWVRLKTGDYYRDVVDSSGRYCRELTVSGLLAESFVGGVFRMLVEVERCARKEMEAELEQREQHRQSEAEP